MLMKVKVHAGARQSEIIRKAPDAYEIWVKAEAERGLANAAALAILAQALNIAPARLRIIKGATTPNKIVKILG